MDNYYRGGLLPNYILNFHNVSTIFVSFYSNPCSVWPKGSKAETWIVRIMLVTEMGEAGILMSSLFSLHTVQPLKSQDVTICILTYCLGLALFCKS